MKETLFPWFQPVIEIASGRIAGYEALARRRTTDGKVESAANVFTNPDYSAAQRLEADRSLRYQALERFAAEAASGGLCLNLSPEWIDQLENLDTLPTLEMIHKVGLDPSRVVLEITERAGDLESIRELAEAYRAAGVRIAYDDFGSGFQQLDRLIAFTPDLLKLDLRMFHNGAHHAQKRAILQMIGQMGAQLGSKIVCEGVETPEDFFLALHCNASYVQGFLFQGAQADFAAPDSMRERVQSLLEQHLDISVEATARRQWQTEGLHSNLMALRDLLRVEQGLEALANYHPARGMLRFFICNRQGEQISPNYRFEDGHWRGDESVTGNNWSWRPYFYQLLGAADYDRRILRSTPYLDIVTGQPCETLSLALDDHRVMLVDVEAPEQSGIGTSYSDLMPALR
ncbi:signal transduction protein [Marinobacterium nitratireducens]|uniref:Signal transduction protein n=1 Tax=Marinobacterium nitratireducens TaxID=518897 RepID=A0A917ZCZ2_9GAMM|nr:EAL domain-containing protein [Marinobacterium nitratireducens]GGO80197.1 signal transduction protein [Marinobacterium nitratireducens]